MALWYDAYLRVSATASLVAADHEYDNIMAASAVMLSSCRLPPEVAKHGSMLL